MFKIAENLIGFRIHWYLPVCQKMKLLPQILFVIRLTWRICARGDNANDSIISQILGDIMIVKLKASLSVSFANSLEFVVYAPSCPKTYCMPTNHPNEKAQVCPFIARQEDISSPCQDHSWCLLQQAWTWSHTGVLCDDTTATCRCPVKHTHKHTPDEMYIRYDGFLFFLPSSVMTVN